MSSQATKLEYNPYDKATNNYPFPTYARLRREAPVYNNTELGFYALSRYDDVLGALHDTDVFCSRHGITLEPRSPLPLLLTMDPPEHTAMRALISGAFTPRRVAEMEPSIRRISAKYVARVRGADSFDVIADYAAKMPMDVISTMLGVPETDHDHLRAAADAMIEREDGDPDITPAGIEGGTVLYQYFEKLVAERRKSSGDDLLSAFLDAQLDGKPLTDLEVVSFCFLFVIAGNETTTKLIGNAMYWLWRHPDQRAALLSQPELIPDAVEETLRFDGSTQQVARTLTRDVTMHDTLMPAGSKVLLILGSANRDEAVFDDPEIFRTDRRPNRHIAFGHGHHVCLGASMARLETKVALEDLLATAGEFDLREQDLVRINSGNVRGYTSMPIMVSAR